MRSGLLVLTFMLGATVAVAQPAHMVGVSGGATQFDLSGTGVTPGWTVHLDRAVGSNWLVGANIGFARPEQQFGERTTLVVPEAQVQYQWGLGRIVPFAGAGVGSAIDFRSDEYGGRQARLTMSGFGGARMFLGESFGLQGEFRLRGIGSNFAGSAAESRGGVFWRF